MVQKLSYTANSITLGAGTSKVVLGADSGNLIVKDSDANTSILEPGVGLQGVSAVVTYANPAALPFNPISSAGSLAYTTSTGALYLSNGSGWYKITLVNTAPSISLSSTTASPTATNLTLDFTYTVTEPEGTPTTVSIANSGIATVGNVAVTHTTSNNHVRLVFDGTTKYSGDASVTLSVTDGVNTGTGTITITTAYYAGTNTAETVALLKATGTGNNGAFDDASASNHTVNKNGTVEQLSFSPYRDNGYSMYFDGSGDYLQIANNSDFDLAGEFAYEFWLYRTGSTSGTYQAILGSNGSGSNGLTFYITQSNGALNVFQSSFIISGSAGDISDYKWHHVLLMRDSSNLLQLFIDGNRVSSSTNNTAFTDNTAGGGTRIGYDIGANGYFKGFITDIRLIKGSTGPYSSGASITVPTERLTAISNTKLLIGGNGFRDASSNTYAVTANGNTTISAFSPYNEAGAYDAATEGGSALFDGSGDYLTIANSQNFYDLGTADWTIECWVYFTNRSVFNGVFQLGEDVGALSAMLYTDGKLKLLENDQAVVFESNTTFVANTWYHIAFTNNDSTNTQKLYVNGVQESNTGSKSTAYSYGNKTVFIGGRWFSNAFQRPMNGYISSFRIVGGSEVYTGNFTVPSAPFTAVANTQLLLNMTNAKVFDASQSRKIMSFAGDADSPVASSGQQHFGENTIFFDGTGDYIVTRNPIVGLEDHTHEAWVYPTAGHSTLKSFFSSAPDLNSGGDNSGAGITVAEDNAFGPNNQGGGMLIGFNPNVPDNEWSHVVLQRQGGIHSLYRNGVLQGTSSTAVNFDSENLRMASRYKNTTAYMFGGYIHDFRISKGLARYPYISKPVTLTQTNSGMEKPDGTTPTVTASNTKLLTAHAASISDGSATGRTVTASGNAAVSSRAPYGGMKSVYLDGNGDYLSIPTSADFNFGNGDFTIEFWIYLTALSGNPAIFDYRSTGTENVPTIWINSSSGHLYYYFNGANRIIGPASSIGTHKWYHVALSRSSSSTNMFVNGSQYGSTYSDSNTYVQGSTFYIGRYFDSTSATYMPTGYISNFRVVKGQGIYTKDFTPITTAFLA